VADYYRDGREFRDTLASGGEGPLMVVRASNNRSINLRDAGNVVSTTIGGIEALSEHAVSAEEFRQFTAATGYRAHMGQVAQLYRDGPTTSGADAFTPDDAQAYAAWLSAQSGKNYRVADQQKLSDTGVMFWVSRRL
jgi:hypothetical protein